MIHDAFPDYPVSDLPAIPAHWKDTSWHNDACPSFMVGGLQVFIDYVDHSKREHPGEPRFHVMTEDTGSVLASDSWEEVVLAIGRYLSGISAYVSRV